MVLVIDNFIFCVISTDKGASNWNDAYVQCGREKGYLDGRANLKDAKSKCVEIRERFPNDFVFWLGIRRQSFQTMDQGKNTPPPEKHNSKTYIYIYISFLERSRKIVSEKNLFVPIIGYSTRPETLEKCEYLDSLGRRQTDLNCSTARYSICVVSCK